MQRNIRVFLILIILVIFLFPLNAEDKRTIPLDLYLIIDGSSALQNSKNDAVAWVNGEVVDGILMDGDKITIWTAGDNARLVYSDTVNGAAGKKGIKDVLATMDARGRSADFSGALRDAASRASQAAQNRMAVTMLVTASAEAMEPAITGSGQGLLRWFRSEKYVRWQVLIVGPNLGTKVQQAAAAYMGTRR